MQKIVSLCILMLLIATTAIGSGYKINNETTLNASPPEDFTWIYASNEFGDWWHTTVEANGQNGIVVGIEDTGGDGLIGKCDYVVVDWQNSNVRQSYYKYHIKDSEYITEGPNAGMWSFEFDYKSKSKNPPKLEGCCHYVNDDNTAGPWDGTLDNPFYSISQALISGSVKEGDNIYVASGEYNEGNLVVEPPVNLIAFPDIFSNPLLPPPEPPTIRCGGGSGPSIGMGGGSRRLECVITGYTICDVNEEDEAGIIVMGDNIKIYGNTFEDCSNAVYLLDSASNNLIFENTITNTDFGIFIDGSCNNNLIYNNIFYDNNYFNAKDNGINRWNIDLPIGGNYWDDYSGEDADGDGFGDTPHPILGEGYNFDDYPIENKTYLKNGKPIIDQFDGPDSGEPGTRYTFAVKFFDPEYDDGYITLDWDDGSTVEIIGPIGSGNEITFEHIWNEKGTYNIRTKATDMYGSESDWETLSVTMPKSRSVTLFSNIFLRIINLYPFIEQILRLINT